MCFPKGVDDRHHVKPQYDDDGSLIYDESYVKSVIPSNVPHHIDSVNLAKFFKIDHDNPIFGFVYESSYEVLIVYTSDEAEKLDLPIYEEESLEPEDPFADESSFEEEISEDYPDQLQESLSVEPLDLECEYTLDFEETLYSDSDDSFCIRSSGLAPSY